MSKFRYFISPIPHSFEKIIRYIREDLQIEVDDKLTNYDRIVIPFNTTWQQRQEIENLLKSLFVQTKPNQRYPGSMGGQPFTIDKSNVPSIYLANRKGETRFSPREMNALIRESMKNDIL
jgi:hypothetical protein